MFVSEEGIKWIRVPRGRRTKSISGVESLVGKAAGDNGTDADSPDDHHFVGEPLVEIESLIIPEIADMQERVVAGTQDIPRGS